MGLRLNKGEEMIIVFYNTIMAVATGVGLISVVGLGRSIWNRTLVSTEGWSITFGILGIILTVLGFVMTVTWPYRAAGTVDANILFGEPSIAFGLLLSGASFYLWQHRQVISQLSNDRPRQSSEFVTPFLKTLKPVSGVVFATGLVMTACAISWARYRLGAAPPSEPISGLVGNHPVLESTFLAVLYGLVALGALLFPLGVFRLNSAVLRVIAFCWVLSGLIFLVFGALNYYTHIGDVVNATTGTHYRY